MLRTFRLDECLDAVTRLTSPRAVWAETCCWLERLGVEGAYYGRIGPGEAVLLHNITADWLPARPGTDLRACAETDPLFTYACRGIRPLLTGEAFMHRYPELSVRDRELIERAAVTGLNAGIAVPTQIRSANSVAGWNLLTSAGRTGVEELWQRHGGAIAFLAHAVHELLIATGPPEAELTGRETDCLRYLGMGLRTKEIAHRMGVQPVTVEYHFANARRKLGARTREQALVLAIRAGLIAL
ncbi:MAG: autoinducer binding domain-containing protein [Rhodobacteraceae bacterium]|nr:autoinducer binding domain-containing protein [Paracoccaceae bacterium]